MSYELHFTKVNQDYFRKLDNPNQNIYDFLKSIFLYISLNGAIKTIILLLLYILYCFLSIPFS